MSITLSTNTRGILNSLIQTADQMAVTQKRLATGKKVNDVIDNASAYFQSQSLRNRASDLMAIKDSIGKAISTVTAATNGLAGVEKVLTTMKGIVESAKAATTVAERTTLSDQYDALRTQLDNLAKDASYNGINLIKASPDSMTVTFNEDASATYAISGIASDTVGLGVTAANDWDNATLATGTANIEGDLTKINAALVEVRSSASTLGSTAAVLKIRSDFTSQLANGLNAGADSLVNADMEAESANMLALQTRQQLGMQSLSMTSQSEQAILTLFR